jgi:two-component system C4-dicarboxylate transport response regulator DctD
MSRGRILFVDDETQLRESAREWLSLSGCSVEAAADARSALRLLRDGEFEALVTDIRMPGADGMALMRAARDTDPSLPVILLTGHGDVALAVEAMRGGAHDFREKPYDADHLVAVIDRAVAARRLDAEVERLRARQGAQAALEDRLIGNASAIVELRRRLAQLAEIDVDILISGETGTGKEVAARALHDFGKRRTRPFVALNCAAIPESVFESELFGHEKGAFTGAGERRIGRIEHADGGTVFLDEVDSMPLALQAKLLRVIQERVVEPLGSNRQMPVDVRFIASTKLDLKAESNAGRFRSDLYFRLATVETDIPPLSARRDDIPLLFRHFAREAAGRHDLPDRIPEAALLAELAAADWAGNVRELRAAAERYTLGLPTPGRSGIGDMAANGARLPERVAAYEASLIRAALEEHGGNAQTASEALGVPRRTLSEKIARYGLKSTDLE